MTYLEFEKNYRINSLFEFYQPLLTTKQNDYLQLYYGDDYSLGEIAENFQVSRQAVYDNIRRTERILETYEQKLHLYQDFLDRNKLADEIQAYVATHYQDDQQLNQLVHQLESAEEKWKLGACKHGIWRTYRTTTKRNEEIAGQGKGFWSWFTRYHAWDSPGITGSRRELCGR